MSDQVPLIPCDDSGVFEVIRDAGYPLKLFKRVITVSLETMKIVRALPRLDISVSH